MITKLELLNVKGITANLELKPCVAIIGPNFSGKTAILESIRLALLGWSPTHGKTAQGLFKLSSGKEMVIRALVGAEKIERRWSQTGAKVSQSKGDELVPPVLVDLNTWLRMTAAERTSNLLAAATQSGTPEDTMARIRLLRVNGEVQVKVHEAAKNRLADLVKDAEDNDANFAQFLDVAIEQEKKELKDAKDNSKRLAAAIQGGSMSQGGAPENVDSLLGESRAKLSVLDKRLGAQVSEMRLRNNLMQEIDALKKEIAMDESAVAGAAESRKRKDVAEKQIADLQKVVALAPTQVTFDQALQDVDDAGAQVILFNVQKDKAEKGLMELASTERCPHCLAKGKGWKDNIETTLKNQLSVASSGMEQATHRLNETRKTKEDLQARLERARGAAQEITHLQRDVKEFADILADVDQAPVRIKTSKDEIAAKQKELQELGPVESVDDLTVQASELRSLIGNLEAQQKQFHAYMSGRAAMAKQAEQHDEAVAQAEVIDQILKILVHDREHLLEQVADSVMERARKLTDGIMPGKLEWKGGEPGYAWDSGRWVSFEVLSGTEKAIVYAGLSVALAHEAKHKIVLIDEMGVMEPINKKKVAERMADLVKQGFIDQFICADADGTWIVPGYQVIETKHIRAK